MTQINRHLRSIKIAPDYSSVKVQFVNQAVGEEIEEDVVIKPHKYSVDASNRPHKDFTDAMKKLRKFAFELIEEEWDTKSTKWTVIQMKIAGDVSMQQSRVQFVLGKMTEKTGKGLEIKTPQVAMYPDKDDTQRYYNAEKMSAQVEEAIEEVWSYLFLGKNGEEIQLPLFGEIPVAEHQEN